MADPLHYPRRILVQRGSGFNPFSVKVSQMVAWIRWIRELYTEALLFYGKRLHAIISLSVSLVALFGIPVWTRIAYSQIQCQTCPDDLSILGVWLVIVPITALALANYYLVMKPALARKRMRTGKNGMMNR